MASLDQQIIDSQKQVAVTQDKINQIGVTLDRMARADTAATAPQMDIANATLADVHKHTEQMNANIAELIMGLDDVTAGFSKDFEQMRSKTGWESFVGAGPLPMRHGLTLGELGLWFVKTFRLDVDYQVVEMQGWQPDVAPGFGWPLGERIWINPSPNAPNLSMARAYAGTVMLEGATLSEGRGTTRPLELFGAPDIDARDTIALCL